MKSKQGYLRHSLPSVVQRVWPRWDLSSPGAGELKAFRGCSSTCTDAIGRTGDRVQPPLTLCTGIISSVAWSSARNSNIVRDAQKPVWRVSGLSSVSDSESNVRLCVSFWKSLKANGVAATGRVRISSLTVSFHPAWSNFLVDSVKDSSPPPTTTLFT